MEFSFDQLTVVLALCTVMLIIVILLVYKKTFYTVDSVYVISDRSVCDVSDIIAREFDKYGRVDVKCVVNKLGVRRGIEYEDIDKILVSYDHDFTHKSMVFDIDSNNYVMQLE